MNGSIHLLAIIINLDNLPSLMDLPRNIGGYYADQYIPHYGTRYFSSLRSLKRKVRLMRSPVCLYVCPSVCLSVCPP
jgi:hypothetical protein